MMKSVQNYFKVLKANGVQTAYAAAHKHLFNRTLYPILNKIRRQVQKKKAFLFHQWIRNNEPNVIDLEFQKQQAQQLPVQPLISLLIPVYNPPVHILAQTLASVANQTYANFECWIANGDPSNLEVKNLLEARAKADPRFKVLQLESNRGIAGNTNAAARMVSGSYVGFLDHDDLLAPSALFEVALSLWLEPAIDLIFSDEDVIDQKGKRFDPFFKPGFSPDLMRSMNYMCHFLVVKRSLAESLGWLREGYDGAQDFDFILRAAELAQKIHRIPKILYHWRSSEGSTADNLFAKPYAGATGMRALQDHLHRTNKEGKVSTNFMPTWYRIDYTLTENPLISIIVPNHNHASDLRVLIDSIYSKSTYQNFEILIMENNSSEQDIFDLYKELQSADHRNRLIEWNHPFNYSMINNDAVNFSQGDVLLFLNNDIEIITPDWLEQMLMFTLRPETGTVGAKLLYPNNTIQHAGITIGIGGVAGHGHKGYSRDRSGYNGLLKQVRNTAANTAACLMVRKEVFLSAGGFNPNYVLAFGDVDFCLNLLEKGYVNVWTPFAELYHHESRTRGYEKTAQQRARFSNEIFYFQQRWKYFLSDGDPYYNPNLTLKDESFNIDPKAFQRWQR